MNDPLLITLIEVQDITPLVDLQPGEDPLVVTYYHHDSFPEDLEEYAHKILETAGPHSVQSFAYTDVNGPPRIVPAGILTKPAIDTIVMAVFAS